MPAGTVKNSSEKIHIKPMRSQRGAIKEYGVVSTTDT